MNDKTTEKNISVFEIDVLIKETYNKIAKWHNGDDGGPALKNLTIELIEDIAGAAFEHLGVPYNKGGAKVYMDEETKKKVEEEREKIVIKDFGTMKD